MRPSLVLMRWTHPRHGSIVEVLCPVHEAVVLHSLKTLGIGCTGTRPDVPVDRCGRCGAEAESLDVRMYVLSVAGSSLLAPAWPGPPCPPLPERTAMSTADPTDMPPPGEKPHGWIPRPVIQPSTCPGSLGRWITGTDAPICPACHVGPGGLDVKRPVRRLGRWTGKVPNHARRQP